MKRTRQASRRSAAGRLPCWPKGPHRPRPADDRLAPFGARWHGRSPFADRARGGRARRDLPLHGDPADRLIVATALHHGAPLVTKDEAIRRSALVQTVW